MASRRRFRAPSVPLGVTKGHSVIRQRSYSPAFHRRPTAFEEVYDYPYHLPKKHYLDTGSEENFLRSSVNRELFLTSAAMEDNYDLAAASRKRDDEIMSKVNREIAASETYTSPRSAVASTRASRPHPQPIIVAPVVYPAPPRRSTATKKEVVVVHAHVLPRYRKRYPPPASARRYRVSHTRPTTYSQAHSKSSREDLDTVPTWPSRAPFMHWYLRNLDLMLLSKLYRARTAAKPRMRSKAALVGSKVEVVRPTRRHPKSKYAAAKLRSMRKEDREEPAIIHDVTSGLKASRPVTSTRLTNTFRLHYL